MLSKEDKLKIKDIVDNNTYFSESTMMDIADEIVPDYGKYLTECDDKKANVAYEKWKEAFNLTWDYVEYKEKLNSLPDNPLENI